MVEVHVRRADDLASEFVLNRDQALGQLADVVVIDERDRGRALGAAIPGLTRELARTRSRSASERFS